MDKDRAAEYDEVRDYFEGRDRVPVLVLDELGWSEHHPSFRDALAAVSPPCEGFIIVSLLMRIAGATSFQRRPETGVLQRTSKEEVRSISSPWCK